MLFLEYSHCGENIPFQNMPEVIFDVTGKKLLFIRILLGKIVYLGKYSVIVGNIYSGIYK